MRVMRGTGTSWVDISCFRHSYIKLILTTALKSLKYKWVWRNIKQNSVTSGKTRKATRPNGVELLCLTVFVSSCDCDLQRWPPDHQSWPFVLLPRRSLMPICIKIGLFFFKISCSHSQQLTVVTAGRTDGQVENRYKCLN